MTEKISEEDEIKKEENEKPQDQAAKTKAQTEGGEAAKRPSTILSYAALAVLFVFASAQVAGVLLRDKVEGRLPILENPPAEEISSENQDAEAREAYSSRFGPGVQEVDVASAAQAKGKSQNNKPQADRPVPSATQEKPVPAPKAAGTDESAAPKEKSKPSPSPVVLPSEGKPQPPAHKNQSNVIKPHLLQVGLYRSQFYRIEEEAKLKKLGVPFFSSEKMSKGSGFKLAVPINDSNGKKAAARVLDSKGYFYRWSDKGVEVYFYLESEAQKTLKLLSDLGLKGGYGFVKDEKFPIWTLYAGPFSKEEVQKTKTILDNAGIKFVLRKNPPEGIVP